MRRLMLAATFVCVLTQPILRYELALNSAVPDIFMLGLIILGSIYVAGRKEGLHLPLIVSFSLIFMAGLLSIFAAVDAEASFIAIIKEIFLYVWFLVCVQVLLACSDDERKLLIDAWLITSIVHAAVIILQSLSPAVLLSMSASLPGKYFETGSPRPLGLMLNPNMAAAYQVLSFFPLLTTLRRRLRLAGWLMLPASVLATGSNAAIVSLSLTLLLIFAQAVFKRRTKAGSLAVALKIIGGGLFAGCLLWSLTLGVNVYFERISELSFGRLMGGAAKRFDIWEDGLAFLKSGSFLVGVGIDNFQLKASGLIVHNDLLAFFVERGLLGLFGFFMFIFSVGRYIRQMFLSAATKMEISRSRAAGMTCLSCLIMSLSHQIFHFRFLWMFLAFVLAYFLREPLRHTQLHGNVE